MKEMLKCKKFKFVGSLVLIVLVIIGLGNCGMVEAGSNGKFVSVGNLNIPRSGHTATLLKDGKVLIVGGAKENIVEIYNPLDKKFHKTGNLIINRSSHTATLLKDGRVLIVGGGPSGTKFAEIYDPKTKKFYKTGELITYRNKPTATLLKDGRVLIVGGTIFHNFKNGNYKIENIKTAEIFDPKTEKFTAVGSCSTYACPDTAILLNDGKVLLAGQATIGDDSEIYDPYNNSFTYIGRVGNYLPKAVLLNDGNVLILGGNGSYENIETAYLYDHNFGKITPTGKLVTGRSSHTATLLKDGRVLVAGGEAGNNISLRYLKSAEIYNPGTKQFTDIGNMQYKRIWHTATVLDNGDVLITGGDDASNSHINKAEIYVNN